MFPTSAMGRTPTVRASGGNGWKAANSRTTLVREVLLSIFRWLHRGSSQKKIAQLSQIDAVTKAAVGRTHKGDHCSCLATRTKKGTPGVPNLHAEPQDQSVAGWPLLERLVDDAACEQAAVLEPSAEIAAEDWRQIITLPVAVRELDSVRELRLYGSHLRRLPPEIGRMTSLANLDIYTSYSLHWLPYEVTRCANLKDSRMSTRALYGNRKTMLPFPRLSGSPETLRPETCSVCDCPFGPSGPQLWWITLRVGTDDAPLLVHSCSDKCTTSLPAPPLGYHPKPHKGGGGVGMPAPDL